MQASIIQALQEHDGYLSGQELSRRLKISRAAVWKHIRELRNLGYTIEAAPHKGYHITSTPDQLFPWEVTHGLKTKRIGINVIHRASSPSTMDEAMTMGIEGAVHGTVVCAETQTRGRGRMGRAWASPSGKGIYASVILRPKVALSEMAPLTLVCAVALCEALRQSTQLEVQIKWPNDLLIRGKKVAGILTELNAEMDRVKFVVVGFGINVNASANALPPEGTSLKIEGCREYSRIRLFQAVLESLEKWTNIFEKHGFGQARVEWKKLSGTLGQRVRCVEPQGEISGQAVDVGPEGSLLIQRDDGQIVKKISGDVMIL